MKITSNESVSKFFEDVAISAKKASEFREEVFTRINTTINKLDEKYLVQEYTDYGIPTEKLEINTTKILENPYYKNIKLNNIDNGKVKYKNKILKARTCLNMGYIKYADKLLKSYMDIGYFNSDINIPILYEGDNIWMSPTIAEIDSMERDVEKAHGHVLTFGLGIGYYIYMCIQKDTVDSVTVIEINPSVIELFNEYILPQINTTKKIEIIHGDMYKYYNEEYLSRFDYIFVDVWKNNTEGLMHYKNLMQTGIRKNNIGYWIEDSLVEPIKMLMAVYFKSILQGNYTDVLCDMSGDTQQEFKMAHKYFRGIDKTITTYDELEYLLNDIETIKNICAIKI